MTSNKQNKNKKENTTMSTEQNILIVGNERKRYSHCLRCGRRLKNHDAMLLGYGPVCYLKIKNESGNRLF